MNRFVSIATPYPVTKKINSEALQAVVVAADDLMINPWADAAKVVMQGNIDLCEQGRQIMDRAIATNGGTLVWDLPNVELVKYGQIDPFGWWKLAGDRYKQGVETILATLLESDPEEIKKIRDYAGLSQQEAAQLVGVTTQVWNAWESGEAAIPFEAWEVFCPKVFLNPETPI